MWSEQELANAAIGGREAAVKIMSGMAAPQNRAIFSDENFSFLWGVLGINGIEGADEEAVALIWHALKKNGAVDAYDKGILGDFNKKIAQDIKDSRMRAWSGLDNFGAGEKFKRLILRGLIKAGGKVKEEVLPLCFDKAKLILRISRFGLETKTKAYLEQIRAQGAACGVGGAEIEAAFDKERALYNACNAIVNAEITFSEEEKSYLFYYLFDAVEDGFDYRHFGLDDQVLAKLVADCEDAELSELEREHRHSRNWEAAEFAARFEEDEGFFEETAARVVKNDPSRAQALTERCLGLMGQKMPKGVVFALELLNLNKVKTAANILLELAKRGRATEAACFIHRLLPKAKGAELMVMNILKLNLRNLHLEELFAGNAAFKEYIVRLYLMAVRAFADAGRYKEGALLLTALADDGWFLGLPEMADGFLELANPLMAADKELAVGLCTTAKKLGFKVYKSGDLIFAGKADDNPLSLARRKFEQTFLGATTFDISRVSGKMAKVEASAYGVYENIKNALNKKGRDAAVAEESDKGNEGVLNLRAPAAAGLNEEARAAADANGVAITEETVENDDIKTEADGVAEAAAPVAAVVSEETVVVADTGESTAAETLDGEAAFFEGGSETAAVEVVEEAVLAMGVTEEENAMNASAAQSMAAIEAGAAVGRSEGVEEAVFSGEVNAEVLENAVGGDMPEKDAGVAGRSGLVPAADLENSGSAETVSSDAPAFTEEDAGSGSSAAVAGEERSVGSAEGVLALDGVVSAVQPTQDTSEPLSTGAAATAAENAGGENELPAFESWVDEKEETAVGTDAVQSAGGKTGGLKGKINIKNILNIKNEDVDWHFEKIKQATAAAVGQAAKIKKRVEETDITQSASVARFKEIAKKIKFFKKK